MFYVYCDLNLDTNTVFYIGSGTKKRIGILNRNSYWKKYINKHPNWKRFIVYETENRKFAYDYEKVLIALNWDYKNLTNIVIDSDNHKEAAHLGGIASKLSNRGVCSLSKDQRQKNYSQWISSLTALEKQKVLENSINSLKTIPNSVCCIYCKKEVSYGNFFRWHGISCSIISSRKKLECNFCNNYYESGNLKQHSRSCSKNPDRVFFKMDKFKCRFCNDLIGAPSLKRHEKSCLSNENREVSLYSKWICNLCNKNMRIINKDNHIKKCRRRN